MASVTVLGLGPMGQALATAFHSAGHNTTVWNRTPGKAEVLVNNGVSEAATPSDAAAASDVVVACVLDYRVAHDVLQQAGPSVAGRTVVNLTAGPPSAARSFADDMATKGAEYLDGCLLTPAPTIGTSSGVALLSGPADVFDRHEPLLSAIGGTVRYLGGDPGRAAAHDAALLDMFWTGMVGVVHGYAIAKAEGIDARALSELAAGIVGLLPDIARSFAGRIDDNSFDGDISSVASAHAGLDHVTHTALERALDTSVLAAASRLTQQAIDAGHGAESLARVSELLGRS